MEQEVRLLNEKIDKLQHHFTVYKTDIVDLKATVKELTNALVGNHYNGNKGVVHLIDSVNKRLEILEKQQPLNDETIKQIKFSVGVFFTAVVGGFISFLFWIFQK